MQPFNVSAALDDLVSTYPTAEAVLKSAKLGDQDARYAIARLWLSEGIPYAFKERPAVYEALRIWLARQLLVEAKQITLIGSGRQGVSLQSGKVGRPFGPKSDLDLSIISVDLFKRLGASFDQWLSDYNAGVVAPRNPKEQSFWDDNKRNCVSAIARGFLDSQKIPTWNRYPEAQKVAQALYVVHEKLKLTDRAPLVRRISLRVYKDWDAFTRQCAINLEVCAKAA